MLRRSHRKSKGGCLECKRRHVKCDENRPKCRLCAVSERECSFAAALTPDASSRSVSLGGPYNDATRICSDTAIPVSVCRDTYDQPVNLDHMELLLHAMHSKDMFNFAVGFGKFHRSGLTLGFKTALQAPYLMHQVLAFSACHLACLIPERSIHFHHQAMALQTRAVSIFNATRVEVDRSNCVPILLFSSMLGQHVLANTLIKRDQDGLDGFIKHYVQCVEMHRGIYTIATSAWPLLMESELEPILSLSQSFTSRDPKGDDCLLVSELVEQATEINPEEKQACRTAISYLQVGLDAVKTDDDAAISRYQMICEWTMLVPPAFTQLLASKQPVALVVLAHYALLLHCGQHLWQVGDAGQYILEIVATYLGPQWDAWLKYARDRVVQ